MPFERTIRSLTNTPPIRLNAPAYLRISSSNATNDHELRNSFSRGADHPLQPVRRGNEVVRTSYRPCVERERVADAAGQSRHALQHVRERLLLGAEADEHGPVVGDRAIGHVPPEDLAEGVLVGGGY